MRDGGSRAQTASTAHALAVHGAAVQEAPAYHAAVPNLPQLPARPMSPAARAVIYGVVGCAMEVAFSSLVASVEARRPVRDGPSTAWMLPIYGLAQPLFEPVHGAVRHRPAWLRGAAYAAGIFAVEAATGEALRALTGACPWDYTGRSRLAVRGVIRLDYAPLWAVAGLGAERLHDAMVGEPV